MGTIPRWSRLCCLALAALVLFTGTFVPLCPRTALAAPVQVGLYETLELSFTASVSPSNPFDTYLLKLQLTDPSGRSFTIEGFYDGDGNGGQTGKIWKARINPSVKGIWSWKTVPGDQSDSALANLSGQFEVISSSNPGGVVASGKFFRWQNGNPVYLTGNFLDFYNGLRTTHTYMSETTSDSQRSAIIARQRDTHTANKANLYFANKGDYSSQAVTPWVGSATSNDKGKMDLARWKKYDTYILAQRSNKMLAEMWFFADDSGFGGISETAKKRLVRYAMARTSAYSHTLYVLALEWQEGWSSTAVTNLGNYLQSKNPWKRLVSVHSLTGSGWSFSGQGWANFIASQPGNDASSSTVNKYATNFFNTQSIPHVGEEFGLLKTSTDTALRNRMWANFAGGAAGGGTGSDLKAFMRFLSQSRIPYQRMKPSNSLVTGSGGPRFTMSEAGHHIMVYSQNGSFTVSVSGSNLKGYWFDPRNSAASLSASFSVTAGTRTFTPPSNTDKDWVLWISDGTNLNTVTLYPSTGVATVKMAVSRTSSSASLAAAPAATTEAAPPATAAPSATPVTPVAPTLTPTAVPTAAPSAQPTATAAPSQAPATPSASPTMAAAAPGKVYVSLSGSGSVNGVSFEANDILVNRDGAWSVYFDGEAVGLGAADLGAFARMADGSLLLSFEADTQAPGLGWVKPQDVLRFTPASAGDQSSGAFEWYLRGADAGLDENSEAIDAIGLTPDGRLVISTLGSLEATGMTASDEDLLAFNSGAWELYFDGSQAGLGDAKEEDVDGVSIDPVSGMIYLSTQGDFSANGVTGSGTDIFACLPSGGNAQNGCSQELAITWSAAANGLGDVQINAIEIE